MSAQFERKDFNSLFDNDSAAVFADLVFRECRFFGCVFSNTLNPRLRSTVKHVALFDCEAHGGQIGPAIIEDVLVQNFKTTGMFQMCGTVFKHVVFKGEIGRLMITPRYPSPIGRRPETDEDVKAINHSIIDYYKVVDWAIDICEANIADCDVRTIPARLIRRDPTTQAIVKRQKVLDDRWKSIDLSGTHWAGCIRSMLERGDDDCVLVAPKRARNFGSLMRGIELLRAEGVAEPD